MSDNLDGGWSNWTVSSCDCPTGSSSGEQFMNRTCTNPVPMYNGSDCVGNETATQACNCPQGKQYLLLRCVQTVFLRDCLVLHCWVI